MIVGDFLNYVFRLATLQDLESIYSLIQERVDWMQEAHISQWDEYFLHHSIEEWKEAIEKNEFYVVEDAGVILGGVQIQFVDEYFWDNSRNVYIKKLCCRVGTRKVGSFIIEEVKKIARVKELNKIRLECLSTNLDLNQIYESYGFRLIHSGTYSKYPYYYNLRELML